MKTYTGACHCKKVRFEVESDMGKVIECNCSHCYMKGLTLIFVPESQFKLTIDGKSAEPQDAHEGLTEYLFNKKIIHHMFCNVCGVESYAHAISWEDGTPTVAVNVRCLDDVDMNALTVTKFEGKNL
jgi:hypothetical protein